MAINILFKGGPYDGQFREIEKKTWSIDIVIYSERNIAIEAHRYNYQGNMKEEKLSYFQYEKSY